MAQNSKDFAQGHRQNRWENSQTSGLQSSPFYHTSPSHLASSLQALKGQCSVLCTAAAETSQTKRKQALLVAAVSFVPCHRSEFFPSQHKSSWWREVQEKHCHIQIMKKQSPNPACVSRNWGLPLDSCPGGECCLALCTGLGKHLQDPVQQKGELGTRDPFFTLHIKTAAMG